MKDSDLIDQLIYKLSNLMLMELDRVNKYKIIVKLETINLISTFQNEK